MSLSQRWCPDMRHSTTMHLKVLCWFRGMQKQEVAFPLPLGKEGKTCIQREVETLLTYLNGSCCAIFISFSAEAVRWGRGTVRKALLLLFNLNIGWMRKRMRKLGWDSGLQCLSEEVEAALSVFYGWNDVIIELRFGRSNWREAVGWIREGGGYCCVQVCSKEGSILKCRMD